VYDEKLTPGKGLKGILGHCWPTQSVQSGILVEG
jgi:hypothetical protein